ncbi:peptidoglycan DD-metalloendopeptidase family protein [Neisseria meningitidis]|uniref:peptidoglycan DD-metalloendopeptidase family protein n=1 Tax=Neisseria meningitidis TaxID=487 RepID=UPI00032F205D|nr:peptidoglycan DD-metalloendopeptidase family protein [Neisseria meningitidis]EOC17092.1 peptidase M23 family protein [Neisseria meningitidis 2002020]MBW3931557.1 peptidoglycan DD-metalloendopeptidase family protein [Neisseria meningitidis]MCL4989778.1 peptidoglycan DD-metalloendopeptidase family protein [Neisseria meningitidis]MCL5683568.1 peptidoglycan DD-metalloendopeptidase family protein [Neisseria meningitidis]MCL5687668.1 peptidoglycan DD-metalloendopeptidase family protein [Neisseria
MRYKPLLLALMLVFSTPAVAAHDAAHNRSAEVKKQTKNKKEQPEAAEGKKEKGKNGAVKDKKTGGKEAAKEGKESKKTAKNRKEAEKEATSRQSARKGREGDKKSKAEHKKAHGKPVSGSKEKNAKTQPENKQGKKEAKGQGNPRKGGKAEKDTVSANKKVRSDKNGKAVKQDKKYREEKNAKTDSDELKAAVAAATNDVENKKALLKQSEGMLLHVSNSLKQLQEERIRQERIRQERIRQARGNLASVNRKQREAWDKFQKLNTELNRLKTEVAATKAQISRFVSGNYKNSQPNAVALFLKNAEPGQKNRFLRYTRYVNASNREVVKDLEKQQKALAVQEQKINNELARLKKIQANVQSLLKKQGVTDAAEQTESRRQNAKIAKDARKLLEQKGNEQQLNKLLSNLEKKKAEHRIQDAEAKRKLAEARLAAAEKARKEAAQQKAEARRAEMSNLTAEDRNIQAPSVMGIGSADGFSRMQGRLKKPVDGVPTGLFGQNRSGGDIWKGVFYSTAPATVESIAPGTVSYADELDGYGKVVVVDHGENYISIYAGLSEISVGKGYMVAAGSKIGSSGSLPDGEEGLYLQIRYQGQVLNPSSWIR